MRGSLGRLRTWVGRRHVEVLELRLLMWVGPMRGMGRSLSLTLRSDSPNMQCNCDRQMENPQTPSAVNTANIQWQTDGWRTHSGCRPRLPHVGRLRTVLEYGAPTHVGGMRGCDAWESGPPTHVGGLYAWESRPPTHVCGLLLLPSLEYLALNSRILNCTLL